MFYTIYKITNKINNKIYVGKHQTENLDDGYFGSSSILNNAVLKYGKDNFTKEVLYVYDNENDMNNMEKEIVNEEFVLRLDTYNITVGGFGGFKYINKHGLNNKVGQFMITAEQLKSDPEYAKWFSTRVKQGQQNSNFEFGST